MIFEGGTGLRSTGLGGCQGFPVRRNDAILPTAQSKLFNSLASAVSYSQLRLTETLLTSRCVTATVRFEHMHQYSRAA